MGKDGGELKISSLQKPLCPNSGDSRMWLCPSLGCGVMLDHGSSLPLIARGRDREPTRQSPKQGVCFTVARVKNDGVPELSLLTACLQMCWLPSPLPTPLRHAS